MVGFERSKADYKSFSLHLVESSAVIPSEIFNFDICRFS